MSRSRKRKRKNKIIIISSVLIIVTMLTGYAAFQTNLSITAKGNIKEKSRVIQSWDENSQTDFHSDFYKQNIVSVTFLDNADVPSNATESWNVSEDKKHGGVIAYVIPSNEDNTKYDLYIGAQDGVIANPNSSYLFYKFTGVNDIEFNNNFDTSTTLNMSWLFGNCSGLTTLDLSSFNTTNVENMRSMFNMWNIDEDYLLSNSLTTIKFGNDFITNNVVDMANMFAGLTKLQSLDVSGFNTSKVTNMYHMFFYLENITTLDLSNFDTSNVTDMTQLFINCKNLKELNLCTFDTRNVLDMRGMFYGTNTLTKVLVGPNWTTINANTEGIFNYSGVSDVTTGQCP